LALLLCLDSVMRVRSFTLHCLPCVLAIAGSSLGADRNIPTGHASLQSEANPDAASLTGQSVNRSGKTDRLPVKRTQPNAHDKAPVGIPVHCKPPIDVLGRCFAALGMSQDA
jgi:hypothetical protein